MGVVVSETRSTHLFKRSFFGMAKEKSHEFSVGISIDSGCISFAKMRCRSGQKPEVISCQSELASNIEEQKLRLSEWVSLYDMEGVPCYLSLSPDYYQLMLVDAPEVPEDEFKFAIRWRVKDLINFPLEDALIDGFLLPEDAYHSNRKVAYVVAAKKDLIEDFVDMISLSGLLIKSIGVEELALHQLAMVCGYAMENFALVYPHGEQTIINLSDKTSLYLTRNVSIRESTELDREDEISFVEKQEESVEKPKYNALILEMQRSMDFYEGQIGKRSISKTMILPGKGMDEQMVQYIDSRLSGQVELFDLTTLLNVNDSIEETILQQCCCAIGAALGTENNMRDAI